MEIQEISVLTIIVFLLLGSLFFLRVMLKDLKTKIELTKKGKLKNKRINRIIKRIDKYGKQKFYFIQGIVIFGLTISGIFISLNIVKDVFFNSKNISITEYLITFLVYFLIFSVYGIIYAKTAWNSYNNL